MDIQEKLLISRCLQNDRTAQKELYDLYKDQMYTLCYRICGNQADASDALQDGFLQVFRNLASFKGTSKLPTWIHTIIARKAIKQVKGQVYFDELTDANETIIDWGTNLDADYLEQAIADLPTGYRSIFTLYEIEGFKHREIAEFLNISESTSKSQLFKGKKMLQENLKAYRK